MRVIHRHLIVPITVSIVFFASPASASHSRESSHHASYRSTGHSHSTHHGDHSYSGHSRYAEIHSHSHHGYSRSASKTPKHSYAAAHHTYVHHHHSGHPKSYAYGAPRDKNGRIKRSEAAKREFMKETGYPNGRPGYVVDHIVPLSKGGADDPSNMQWQTVEDAKAKDRVERK